MKCNACNSCKVVYRRTGVSFWRGKVRYCTAHKTLVKTNDGCEKWTARKIEYDLSAERLDCVQDDIIKLIRNSEL